jgi:DNA-binding PadR family transcriptional regulator
MTSEQLKGHLDPLLLAVLEQGPAHGYAVIEALRERSDGAFDLPEGTIYPALHRLERSGAITSTRERAGGRERRVYRLSTKGRTALKERRAGWTAFSSAVDLVLGMTPA